MSNMTRGDRNDRRTKTRVALWIVQVVLAALFLFAGGFKLIGPVEQMAAQAPIQLPGLFMQFIGVCEVAGALGLILPGLLRIRPELTTFAAVGLVAIMSGATTITIEGGVIAPAIMPAVVGALAAFVAYGRWKVAPFGAPAPRTSLQPARA